MIKFVLGATAAAVMLATASAAGAVTTIAHFSLSAYDPASFTPPSGFTSLGDITVTDNGLGLYFDVELDPGYLLKKSNNGNFHALAWDMDATTWAITNLVNNLGNSNLSRLAGTSFSAPPFTTGAGNSAFNYAIDCGGTCVNGPDATKNPNSFHFKIPGASLSNLVAKNKKSGVDVWFAADVTTVPGHGPWSATSNAQTFNVGAYRYADTSAAPEPQTWAMMIGGFGAIGASLRRRRTAATA